VTLAGRLLVRHSLRRHEPGAWPAVLDVFALVMGLAAVQARREAQPDRCLGDRPQPHETSWPG
jgi:hypothetical protein